MTEDSANSTPVHYSGDNIRSSWAISLDALRANIMHCTLERKEAIISAFLWCMDKKHPVSRPDFCEATGINVSTFYKVLTARHRHPTTNKQLDIPEDMADACRQFVIEQKKLYISEKELFVNTPTNRRIWTGCNLARESHTIVFVYSRSHIGKTWSLEEYTAKNNHGSTVFISAEAASGLGGLVKLLASALGISPKRNTYALIRAIKNAVQPDMLIIVDELHKLLHTYRKQSFFACIEFLREIHDECKCGMVFSGTQLLSDEIQKGKKSELEQVFRRGVHRIVLAPAPTTDDLKMIFAKIGLEFPKRNFEVEVQGVTEKPYFILKQLAINDGLLAITERLRYAKKLADRDGVQVTWEHFVDVHLTILNNATEPQDGWQ